MSQFQLYRDGRGEYRWRLITQGGTVIATGSEGYISRGGAGIAIQAVKEVTPSAPIVDKTGDRSEPTMPVFTIKAQDALAPEAVEAYRDLCTKHGLHAQAAQVQLALDEIARWQHHNEDRLRLPDHAHVPVTE